MPKEQTGRGLLGKYFPMIRTREEIEREIQENRRLSEIYEEWNEQQRKVFLDCCTGVRGVKVLYDSFFKEIMNPEYAPQRLEELLSLILGQKVKVMQVLPPDSARIADENSLLIMDIVVELSDGSIANVEVQKIGYRFPGERCACYSADLLLRQYRRVREESTKRFSYRNIKNVYTIILFEKSPKAFHEFENVYIHHFEQATDTGLKINLLQEYNFIALDIFRKNIYNKGIQNELEAWLTFLSVDDPEMIVELLERYPRFQPMYEEIYEMCRSTERVMGMFSKELKELDDNTVEFMIDELQEMVDKERARADRAEARMNEAEQEKQQALEKVKEIQQKYEELLQQQNKTQ
jgi:hypothetical protein